MAQDLGVFTVDLMREGITEPTEGRIQIKGRKLGANRPEDPLDDDVQQSAAVVEEGR